MTKEKEMECLGKWTKRSAITHGISDERLMEICEAERAGRCVVLPCKPSDYDIIGDISLERLQEICEAEKGGRCITLPHKPSGVTVYEVRDKKHASGIGVSPRHVSCTMVWADGDYRLCHQGTSDLNQLNFGKRWFLREEQAREEAERRKSGGQNGEEKF